MSVSSALYGKQIGHYKWFDFYNTNPAAYKRLLKFSVCRDPIARFTSAFNFLKAGGVNEADRTYAETCLSEFPTAENFALALADAEFRSHALRKVHFFPQVKFVCSAKRKIMVDYLIDLSRLEDDLPRVL